MQINATNHPESSQVELEITVDKREFQPYIDEAVRDLTKDRPLKGFRPGKAPQNIVVETFGSNRVLSEALDRALSKLFVEAVVAKDIEALGRPAVAIKNLTLDAGMSFTAKVDILPTVTLGDPKSIKIERRAVNISDEQAQKELDYLARSRSTFIDVARPAQAGDTVVLDFKVSVNGQVIEGGESKNHPVTLGEGHFVPGFEDKLIGIQADDVREFEITFPSTYQENLRDKKAQVWVQAHAINKRVVPEINDDFAKSLGRFQSLTHLKEELQKNMRQEAETRELERQKTDAANKLAEASEFGRLPDSLIESEINHRLEEFAGMLAMQNKTMEDYLKREKKDIQAVRQEMRPSAEKNIKVSLALRALAKAEKIEASEAEIEIETKNYLKRYASVSQARDNIDEEDIKINISNTLRHQKTIDKLLGLVQVSTAK